ncbi:hypothetical protein [Pseudomonas sp. SDO52101_S400]
MRLSFSEGAEVIEIGDRIDVGQDRSGADETAIPWVLHESWQVERFVRWHFRMAQDIHRLRALLSGQQSLVHRLDDQEILRQLSQRLLNGSLSVRTVRRNRTGTSASTGSTPVRREDGPSPASAVGAKKNLVQSRSPTFQPMKSDPPMSASAKTAQDSQAQRLEEAAAQAIPFCEVCHRAAMERV